MLTHCFPLYHLKKYWCHSKLISVTCQQLQPLERQRAKYLQSYPPQKMHLNSKLKCGISTKSCRKWRRRASVWLINFYCLRLPSLPSLPHYPHVHKMFLQSEILHSTYVSRSRHFQQREEAASEYLALITLHASYALQVVLVPKKKKRRRKNVSL